MSRTPEPFLREGDLVLGGFKDGQRTTILYGSSFMARPVPDALASAVVPGVAPPEVEDLPPATIYRREEIHAPGGPPLAIWVAEHLTLHDAIVLLIRGYHGWGNGVVRPERRDR